VEISEVTQVPLAKWPLWTWIAYPALAIIIGGGLGYFVAVVRQNRARQSVHATAEAVVAAPQPSAPSPPVDVAPPSPEIEIEPEPVKTANDGLAPRLAPKSKAKPKSAKPTRCNVYDHMNGC
jgi:hypothetical protein